MSTYIIGVIAVLFIVGFIFEMLRRGILREKFAALWLIVSLILLFFAVLPQTLLYITHLVGIELPANFLFALAAVTLLLVSIQLSYEVSRLEARTRRLAEDLAILRGDVENMRKER